MSSTGVSPEFERKMQEIAEKTAHMVIPRSKVQTPITEPRYPAWTEEPTTPTPMIPMEAIEAAAIALAAASEHWFRKGSYRSQARLVLEAAAPYMLNTDASPRLKPSGN